MNDTMTAMLDHRLDLLTLFNIDIENCKDETEIAEKIYDHYVGEDQLERLEGWAAEALSELFGDYRRQDFFDMARDGFKGVSTWEKIDYVSHICTYIEGCGYDELKSVLEAINKE